MGEGIIIGGLLIALLSFFGGGDDEDVPKPKPDRDPFCPPHPVTGQPQHWDADAQTCVPFVPGTPEPKQPGFDMVDPDDGGDIDEITRPVFPEPGTFYGVKQGDILLGTKMQGAQGQVGSIAYRALRRAGFLAARDFGGLPDADAHNWGAALASNGQKRVEYLHALQCSTWNDHLYGTYGYTQGVGWPTPETGRAIRMMPRHAANYVRLKNGQAPIRSIRLRTPNDKGKGNGNTAPGAPGGHLEFLWLPGLDLQHLWLTGGQLRITEPNPPQWVLNRGVDDRSNAGTPPNGWGC